MGGSTLGKRRINRGRVEIYGKLAIDQCKKKRANNISDSYWTQPVSNFDLFDRWQIFLIRIHISVPILQKVKWKHFVACTWSLPFRAEQIPTRFWSRTCLGSKSWKCKVFKILSRSYFRIEWTKSMSNQGNKWYQNPTINYYHYYTLIFTIII